MGTTRDRRWCRGKPSVSTKSVPRAREQKQRSSWLFSQNEMRATLRAPEQLHRTRFGPTHHAFFRRHEIVVAREVEPAVDEVKRELGRKIAAVLFCERGRSVDRDADFPGKAGRDIAFKC